MGRGFIAICGSTLHCAKNSLLLNIRFGVLDVPFRETLRTSIYQSIDERRPKRLGTSTEQSGIPPLTALAYPP